MAVEIKFNENVINKVKVNEAMLTWFLFKKIQLFPDTGKFPEIAKKVVIDAVITYTSVLSNYKFETFTLHKNEVFH